MIGLYHVRAFMRGHIITAAARNPSSIPTKNNVTAISLNVNDANAVAEQAKSADVIICAVSPRNTADATKDALTFTEALVDAQRQTGKRLLMVGGGSSLNMPNGTNCLELTPESILPEATGMRQAYALMVQEDIDFAVLAPGGMFAEGEKTGKFRLSGRTMLTNAEGGKSTISPEDYAVAMLDEVETPKHFRTIFNVAY